MPRVLLAGPLHEAGMAVLRGRAGLTIEQMEDLGAQGFIARLPDANALLLRTAVLPAEAVERAEALRVVSRHGVGYDNVPLEALTAKGVPLTVVGQANADSVAEQALFLMFALAKQGLAHDRAVRQGAWERRNALGAVELAGKTLLVLGFGRTGRAVAARAMALGMEVMAHDPVVPAAAMAGVGVAAVADWRGALAEADIVTLHVPRTAETVGMIGRAELGAMKPSAFLVNTARGGLIDENALVQALERGAPAGAGLDTFEAEPPPPDHPLFRSDRVVLSPHIAGMTKESIVRMAVRAAENVLAGLDGRLDPDFVVNREVLTP